MRLVKIVIIVAVVLAVLYFVLAARPAPPQKGVVIAVYNVSDGRLYIASDIPVFVNGVNATRHVLPAVNSTHVSMRVAGREFRVKVEYVVVYTQYTPQSAQGYLQNTGDVPIRASLGGKTVLIPPGGSARFTSPEPWMPPPRFSAKASVEVVKCVENICTARAELYVSGPPGSVYTYVSGTRLLVSTNVPFVYTFDADYGSKITVSAAGSTWIFEIKPRIEVSIANASISCSDNSCSYRAVVRIWSEVDLETDVGGRRVFISANTSLLTTALLDPLGCVYVSPVGQICNAKYALKPPSAEVVAVRWLFSERPVAIITLRNPGHYTYAAPAACIDCTRPPAGLPVDVPVNPREVRIPPLSSATYAFYAATAVVIGNRTIALTPPPPPKISVSVVSYTDSARRGKVYVGQTEIVGVLIERTYTLAMNATAAVDYQNYCRASGYGVSQFRCLGSTCTVTAYYALIADDANAAAGAGLKVVNKTIYFPLEICGVKISP